MNDETLTNVREWLERGGYVLEMEVARRLMRRTNLVSQGEVYTDPVTGSEREIDVTAVFLRADSSPGEDKGTGRLHGLRLVIECKNTTAPWIGFVGHGGGNGGWIPSSSMDPDSCDVCNHMTELPWEMALRCPHVYSVTEKRAKNTPDHAHAGTKQVTSAILAEYGGHDEQIHERGHDDSQAIPCLAVPVVVTTSPLILCELDAKGQVNLTPTGRMFVGVAGYQLPDEATETEVWLVNISDFEDFLDDILQAIADPPQSEAEGALQARA